MLAIIVEFLVILVWMLLFCEFLDLCWLVFPGGGVLGCCCKQFLVICGLELLFRWVFWGLGSLLNYVFVCWFGFGFGLGLCVFEWVLVFTLLCLRLIGDLSVVLFWLILIMILLCLVLFLCLFAWLCLVWVLLVVIWWFCFFVFWRFIVLFMFDVVGFSWILVFEICLWYLVLVVCVCFWLFNFRFGVGYLGRLIGSYLFVD